MSNKTLNTRQQIEWILQSPMTSYQIAKESGVPITPIVRLRSGESAIDNLQFKSIEKLEKYYNKLQKENSENTVNGVD